MYELVLTTHTWGVGGDFGVLADWRIRRGTARRSIATMRSRPECAAGTQARAGRPARQDSPRPVPGHRPPPSIDAIIDGVKKAQFLLKQRPYHLKARLSLESRAQPGKIGVGDDQLTEEL